MTYDDMTVTQLTEETLRLERGIAQLEATLAELRHDLVAVSAERANRLRPSGPVSVTNHALLRYIERILGIDVEGLRTEILSANVIAAIEAGACSITVNGVRMVVANNRASRRPAHGTVEWKTSFT